MFADQFGLDIDYRKIEAGPDEFEDALTRFRQGGGTGCNVTVPLKAQAWHMAVESSPEVGRAQAANTLVYQDKGWFAHNTDGTGLMADLAGNHKVQVRDKRILILGAGGATAGILGKLLVERPAELVLVNRNLERAESLAQRFLDLGEAGITGWDDLAKQGCFDLVFNATSLGHQGKTPPVPQSVFAAGSLCYDLNYFKASQPLKVLCEDLDQPYIDGLGMLVEQAAESFRIWTGKQPDSRAVIQKLRDGDY